MSLAINTSVSALSRAEQSRVERASRDKGPDATSSGKDSVEITGAARPRSFGERHAYVSRVADQSVQMRQAALAYQASGASSGAESASEEAMESASQEAAELAG